MTSACSICTETRGSGATRRTRTIRTRPKRFPKDLGSTEPVTDTELRVLRGGSFNYPPSFVRAAGRINLVPTYSNVNIGFRPVRTYLEFGGRLHQVAGALTKSALSRRSNRRALSGEASSACAPFGQGDPREDQRSRPFRPCVLDVDADGFCAMSGRNHPWRVARRADCSRWTCRSQPRHKSAEVPI